MIPEFDERGFLPDGIHHSSWEEFVARYALTEHRKDLIAKMENLIVHLKAIQCQALYVDGSFITRKEVPNDYDACWDMEGVKFEIIDPILLDGSVGGKQAMQTKYGGDIRPDKFSPSETDATYLTFFQVDRNGKSKGIVKLSLSEIVL